MKHLRITVEGKVYEVAVEIIGPETGEAVAEPRGHGATVARNNGAPAKEASIATPATKPAAATTTSATNSATTPVATDSAATATPATGSAIPPAAAGSAVAVCSPLTALVVSIDVAVGDAIAAGDRLVTLEAMKMNTIVNAPSAGKVTAIHVAAADGVEEGQPLVSVA